MLLFQNVTLIKTWMSQDVYPDTSVSSVKASRRHLLCQSFMVVRIFAEYYLRVYCMYDYPIA